MKAKSKFSTPAPADLTPEQTASSEIRKHYYLDRYVVIAPKRNLKPDSFGGVSSPHKIETASSPAIENDPSIYEVKDKAGRWQVKVIDNLYPALSLDNPKAYGKQEIVIETPEHNLEFSELSIPHIEQIFQVYAHRIKALNDIKDIRYVSVFKNDGPRAGASIAHAHSQIAAVPIIPPHLASESAQIEAYRSKYESCPHCDVINWETQQKVRVIQEDKHLLAISPYAGRYPFGAWLMPRRHVTNFTELAPEELHSMAVILKKITSALDKAGISFNFFLHDSLPEFQNHFILQVEPRGTPWAGFEISTGLIINPVAPEYAASWYRAEASNKK